METILSLIELGGPVVAILAVMSVVSLAVILLKLYQYWFRRVGSRKRAQEAVAMWLAGNGRGAHEHASAGRSISARLVASAISMRAHDDPRELIEERLTRQATGELHELQSGFRFLDAVAQISPLLGLFGTVLGMIEAFRELQAAGNAVDPSVLAGGIWVALLTTAAGLAVAMPVSLVLTWLESRIDDERVTIETLTTDILTGRAPAHARSQARAPSPNGEMAREAVVAH